MLPPSKTLLVSHNHGESQSSRENNRTNESFRAPLLALADGRRQIHSDSTRTTVANPVILTRYFGASRFTDRRQRLQSLLLLFVAPCCCSPLLLAIDYQSTKLLGVRSGFKCVSSLIYPFPHIIFTMENSSSSRYDADPAFKPLLDASNSCTIKNALEILIEVSRTSDGRSELASQKILTNVLNLCQLLTSTPSSSLLLLSLKLLRNLCAGELINQDLFVQNNGVEILSLVLDSVPRSDFAMVRMGLQVLANVSLAGDKHQLAIWFHFFPLKFAEIASIQRKETCDPLCMIIYTCCKGSNGLIHRICEDEGLPILAEIIRTASAVGSGEDWLNLLLSKICLEQNQFRRLFARLRDCAVPEDGRGNFVSEQAYLLSVLSEFLNNEMDEIRVPDDFAMHVLEIFKQSAGSIGDESQGNSGLPTVSVPIDVLGYSLTILRDICSHEESRSVVDSLLSGGLVETLLGLLRELEPPEIIKKAAKQSQGAEGTSSDSTKPCPYKGFRRDIVAVIGNSAYRRRHVQDEIREKNGLLLMLQQCSIDDNNPFLREWGIWSMRNLLEGNAENQRVVTELELQGSVDIPEFSRLGLKVEVDKETRRAKLVNV